MWVRVPSDALRYASLAQLDRALVFETRGWWVRIPQGAPTAQSAVSTQQHRSIPWVVAVDWSNGEDAVQHGQKCGFESQHHDVVLWKHRVDSMCDHANINHGRVAKW